MFLFDTGFVTAVDVVIPVTWVVLLFSRRTGLATLSFRLTTRFLFIVYLSGDLLASIWLITWACPRVYTRLWFVVNLSFWFVW